MLSSVCCSFLLLMVIMPSARAARLPHEVMPAPAEFQVHDGRLPIDAGFSVFVSSGRNERLARGLWRALNRWQDRTGFTFPRALAADAGSAKLVIACADGNVGLPGIGDDESYTLEVTPERVTLRAPNTTGVLHGLETLLQLLEANADGFFVPAVSVRDAPRFPWRGLLVDVCRHWQSLPVIKRTLDGMALVKLNVLHLHLTEDQGFRVESKRYPRLHELGSDGNFFTQDEIREIIDYAAARGIRVVPEFDMPGHATSWLVGHPEIASAPGPYAIERHWGVFDPTLDPTNEKTYELLDGFLGEMAALFPDPYIHIGGDENNGRQWDANPRIQTFIREHGLKDNHGLQAYFNRRVLAILTKHGKRMIGWDEIFHPDLPNDVVIQSWRGPDSLAEAARQGYDGILSNGYYIDLCHPAREHYLVDPLPAVTTLTPDQQAHVLGGEATMWSEWVTPETIDSRIWPRTAAIAERLWSPRSVRDVDDMYRRLANVASRLEELGLSIHRNRDVMLRRLAGDAATPDDLAALRLLAGIVEPVKGYERGQEQPGATQFTPLAGLVDCAQPESAAAREFASLVDTLLIPDHDGPGVAAASSMRIPPRPANPATLNELKRRLQQWNRAAEHLRSDAALRSPRIRALTPLLSRLSDGCTAGIEVCDRLLAATAVDEAWRDEKLAALDAAARPYDACELPFIPALRRLTEATAPAKE